MKQTTFTIRVQTTSVANASYRGEVPESGYRGEVPESGYRGEVPESGYRVEESVIDYLDFSDGTSFQFKFVPQNDGQYWDVDILDQPSYGSLPDDEQSTNRVLCPRPDCEFSILFDDPFLIDSKGKAKSEAKLWAEKTWRYINNGVSMHIK